MTNNGKGQQHEIRLKLGLQSTEAYFPLLLTCFVFLNYYIRRSVLFKIHAANIEASKFVCFCPKISQMLVVYICYCYNFHIFLSFASESRVATNTILLQRDVLWTGNIY